ncbi:MAG: rRNA pseudouridine synthase, partial [Lentisphaeria bacterium]|nr:rRNA pseudouridine synthase [Lentisphaeria bacterium]
MSEYLAKFIARSGAAARRKAAELVKSGSVRVNGRVITDPAFSVDITGDRVELNGKILQAPAENIYIMLNKPVGYT